MVAESWFRNLWKNSKKHEKGGHQKVLVGVLAFEVASLMSKLVHVWQSLSDKQVARLRDEIMNSVGIKKLISDDDSYIARMICTELVENLGHVAIAVSRLAKKCNDPFLKSFEQAFNDLLKVGADPYGWQLSWKKMDKKIKKMERFIVINANLYQEMENLSDLEQTLRRLKGNDDADSITLVEYEKKLAWKQQEVKHLKNVSIWNRTYDYTVRLLARSLFSIFSRIGHVFGVDPVVDERDKASRDLDSDQIYRSHSVAYAQSSVHPSETSLSRFSSEPVENILAKSGPISSTRNIQNSYSGPLKSSTSTASPIPGRHSSAGFYSGPLGRSTTKSGPLPLFNKSGMKWWKSRDRSGNLNGKSSNSKHARPTSVGPLKGCMMVGNGSPLSNCHLDPHGFHSGFLNATKGAGVDRLADGYSICSYLTSYNAKKRLLNAPPETLGASALALHYANVIIVIEKLVASPHLIGHDAREDLYNMLPASLRAALRAKLKPFAKGLTSSVYDTVLAGEWNEAMLGILEWLAPLAHNMIRWQSERSFEHQNFVSRTNVLLVQTLYYANQEKTESAITELLVGLNYIWRYGREVNAKAIEECASARMMFNDDYLDD
ncbi:uncharacterized protein LOC129899662 [Solanum dulcamara]|uniref:uncharacterized protein LOC129899662 n=1 Tax=Solanum dulcamara TaxID=45834 RepID=UPI002485A924|nr:uncharacterized protein LOC129899662 [Solanum dulcamara]XP_055830664.1 uncharacterized protein LOC129899662 [Solanum dulcamara]